MDMYMDIYIISIFIYGYEKQTRRDSVILYQHRKVIKLEDVIWDSRVFQVVCSGYQCLHTK